MKRLLAVLAWPLLPRRSRRPAPRKTCCTGRLSCRGRIRHIGEASAVRAEKEVPAIETIIQYKPGVGGAVMWNQMNTLPADGLNIVGINLPHIVLAPFEGQVQYKTEDITPAYWFPLHPDRARGSRIQPLQRPSRTLVKAAKAEPGKLTLGGSGSTRPTTPRTSASTRSSASKTLYIPYKGTGDMTVAVAGGHVGGAMSYTAFAINNKGKMRALAVAMTSATRCCRTRRRSRNWA